MTQHAEESQEKHNFFEKRPSLQVIFGDQLKLIEIALKLLCTKFAYTAFFLVQVKYLQIKLRALI